MKVPVSPQKVLALWQARHIHTVPGTQRAPVAVPLTHYLSLGNIASEMDGPLPQPDLPG